MIGHDTSDEVIELHSYCGLVCDLCLRHHMVSYGVSGLIIGASISVNGIIWNSNYTLIYYDQNDNNHARLIGLYMSDGIVRFISTHRKFGDRLNWMTSASLVTRNLHHGLDNLLSVINDWEKENKRKVDFFLQTFENSNLIFVTDDQNNNRCIYVIDEHSDQRKNIVFFKVETFKYKIKIETTLSLKLNSGCSSDERRIVVKFLR